MLQKRKNELTVSILSRLKAKGPPEPQVQSFSPMGDDQEEDQEAAEDAIPTEEGGDDHEKLLQAMYPRRKKLRRGLSDV